MLTWDQRRKELGTMGAKSSIMSLLSTMTPGRTFLLRTGLFLALLYHTNVSQAYNEPSYRTLVTDADCGGCHTGVCVEPVLSSQTNPLNSETFGPANVRPSCQCKGTGYIGLHCEIPCAKQCENGGKCLPADGNKEQRCSCTKAVVNGNPFVGERCEYGATKSCMTLGSFSKHSFCTNGGECADIVGDNELHVDCLCTSGFTGSHCEYKVQSPQTTQPTQTQSISQATSPEDSLEEDSATSQNDLIYILIAVVSSFIVFMLLAFIFRARRRNLIAKLTEKESLAERERALPTRYPALESENEII